MTIKDLYDWAVFQKVENLEVEISQSDLLYLPLEPYQIMLNPKRPDKVVIIV